MKNIAKHIIINFAIYIVAGQFLCNLLYFINPQLYYDSGFYLGALFGINTGVALFLFVFTMYFRFCWISRICAIAEVIAAGVYLIIKEDGLYNIFIQTWIFGVALILTGLVLLTDKPKNKWMPGQ